MVSLEYRTRGINTCESGENAVQRSCKAEVKIGVPQELMHNLIDAPVRSLGNLARSLESRGGNCDEFGGLSKV